MSRRIERLAVALPQGDSGLLSCARSSGRNSLWTYNYLPPSPGDVALSMPRSIVTYSHEGIFPAFEQSLPEMDLSLFPAALWKLVQPDEMGLLWAAGNRRLGRLRFTEPGTDAVPGAQLKLSYADIDRIENGEAFLMDMLSRLAWVPGVAGVQPKTLAQIEVARLQPARADIDTHLLKGCRTEFPWVTLVEHACLQAAQACGIDVPRSHLSGDGRLLAVERFDLDAQNQPLGFDEACALLGLFAEQKYQGSYERMASQLRRFIAADKRHGEMRKLLRLLIFNYAIENGDAHLKNFGLLYDDPAQAQLSPAYDLVTTTAFPSLRNDAPALSLSGRKVWDAYASLAAFARKGLLLTTADIRGAAIAVHEGLQASLSLPQRLAQQYPLGSEILAATEAAWRRGLARLGAWLAS